MYKNPYLQHAQKAALDSQSEAIIKKAKRYSVVVYDNPTLGANLLNPNVSNISLRSDMVEFFTWFLQQEKNIQMSS